MHKVPETQKFLAAALCSLGCFGSVFVLWAGGFVSKLDALFSETAKTFWGSSLDSYAFALSAIGNLLIVFIVVVLLAFIFWQREHPAFFLSLLASASLSANLVEILKTIFGRLRPEQSYYLAAGYSFPSGHAALSAAVAFTLIYIIYHSSFSVLSKRLLAAIFVALSLMVSVSRIYLNAHWFSDVLAGYFLGIFVASFFTGIIFWSFHEVTLPSKRPVSLL